PGDETPLILDENDRLYLFRYWEYEHLLVRKIQESVNAGFDHIDEAVLKKGLAGFFERENSTGPDWQEVACFAAVTRSFCVISGGPGTGKSTVVARILALIALQHSGHPSRMALAAPTGKAAQRLQEAIRAATDDALFPESIRKSLPSEASTIHRLLGPISGSPFFRHHAENPLAVDGVIVDEASMVDLPLMSKLVQALPSHARLILLGDQDQLASVEAGAVLGDICDRGSIHRHSTAFCAYYHKLTGQVIPEGPGPLIQDSLVRLEKNYRFGEESGIGSVSRAVNRGDGEEALIILKNGSRDDVSWVRLPDPINLPGALRDKVLSGYRSSLETQDPEEAFLALERFRIMCALRKGPYGVLNLNRVVERILQAENLISQEGIWYRGRPILITRNDYTLGLFNGDVGLIFPDPDASGDPRALFRKQDGSIRKIHPARLPEHETVFAMTVHKSQGSEFDEVVLILPDQPSPILTRELIYTGLTRARKRGEVWGLEEVFLEGVSRRIERSSGLREALWQK
ncbi:MAG: exodeoxyribonuclease V subunit alpha, partial [Deltaproteobacteria bacterium]|nr:exodeoxyribonuclease V subunit alpha [Deltaproteobacteria bacterium]